MKRKRKLKELLAENGSDCRIIDLKEATINRVDIDLKNKSIFLRLTSIILIFEEEIEILKDMLSKRLPTFDNININVVYKNTSKDINKIMTKYWKNIAYIIGKEIPSSSVWIKHLQWKIEDDFFYLFFKDEVIMHSFKNNQIDKKIKYKIRDELGINLNVIFKLVYNDIKENDKILLQSMEEEKSIAKNIIESDNKLENNKVDKVHVDNYIYGSVINGNISKISEININSGSVIFKGKIFDVEFRDIKSGKTLYTFNVSDFTSSTTVKVFLKKGEKEKFQTNVTEGVYVKIQGEATYDSYSRCLVIMLKSLNLIKENKRMDYSENKRVELHLHTQMSSMDGMTKFSDFARQAKEWGHNAIAITDHGVVQSFPEGMEAGKKYGIKVIYGLEGYLVDDSRSIVINHNDEEINTNYVVFDIETTGLSPINNKITEIGAVKIKDGKIIDQYNQLINPQTSIPDKIVKLTGITDKMVKDSPTINEILPDFFKFIKGSVLVAHNASFDVGFIRHNLSNIDLDLENPILDTLELSRTLFPNLKSHKLNIVAKHLKVSLENHHRAVDDAKATADIFLKCLGILEGKGIKTLDEINIVLSDNKKTYKEESYHIVILVKNYTGLKNLYRIVSESHLKFFYRRPRIPKSLLIKYREGLIIGSACEAGELYKAILRNKDYKEIREIVKFYDYLEIQPLRNNYHLIRNGMIKDEEGLKDINIKIVELGNKYSKSVVATGDVHFLNPEDEVYRRILMAGQGFSDADNQAPLYFKTTDEMLDEFSYLGKGKANEVVIENTNKIADMCEEIIPIPDGTFPPVIDGAEEQLRDITTKRAKEIYGDNVPDLVKERLDKELNSIIKNGYAVMYIIAQKLVWKSLEDGYLVGSRGSVGSSFAATMSGITEVNPLPPHYICSKCKYSEFIKCGKVGSGIDLPDKNCPHCGTPLNKDGYDIPFEVFLGFEGDKEPDIDLNFAGEYQPCAHKYTEELFGTGYVYRAGTIGTIAEKTAYGFVKKYYEGKETYIHPAEINRLVSGMTGIKRTSGQHPGGVMIVPKYKDIHDFTPIQYPANDKKSGVITTHFDYHSISGRILKLDILGHDVPTIIRMLEDITGIDPQKIPLDDKETMKIFTSTDPLGITSEDINMEVGTLGIPEFGTKFVRQMLVDTKPSTFAELVRISGLSHGTDVWLNNAQELVRNKTATLSNVISTRDDIMLYLISKDLDKKRSFKIMEKVRKGKGLTEEDESYMREMNIPEWYIESCKKIKYMFPKAHAVAYVLMSFRIAYFKVHYPEAFYATYFTTKTSDFHTELILQGKATVRKKIDELESLNNDKTAKEKNLLTVLEVVLEMYSRGLSFECVDLYKSDSDKFLLGENGIIPPLKSLQGMGETAARNIVYEREKSRFISVEDLMNRTKVSKAVIESLKSQGCLKEIPESNQLSLFNI